MVPLSTLNLLLNGYRALAAGMPLVIYIDVEYSTNEERFGTLLIGVCSLDNKFHIVAYAIVSKEDALGHEYALRMVKAGVESAVQKYRGGLV